MKMQTSCLLAITVLLAGCWQKSVNPFYTNQDVITEPRLIGTWTEEKQPDGNRTTWTFANVGGTRLDVAMQNKDEKYEFNGRLFRLGEDRFLDLEGKARGISTIPAHHLLRVVALGPELKLAMLNIDWMQKWLRQHPESLPHITITNTENPDNREKDELVLTADTKALQKFVREHLNDEDFFTDVTVLKNESVAASAGQTQ